MSVTRVGILVACAAALGALSCSRQSEAVRPVSVRLVDRFDPKLVANRPATPPVPPQRIEWRFGEAPPPSRPLPANPPAGPPAGPPLAGPVPPAFPATRGWHADGAVADLAIRDGLLVGRTTGAFPIIAVERTSGLQDLDQLYAIEIRMRASAGTNLDARTAGGARLDIANLRAQAGNVPWPMSTPIVPGNELQTYVLVPERAVPNPSARYVLIRPTNQAGATFAIESIRLVKRREHLLEVPSGVSWQGLREIFRESIVARSPESMRFTVRVPSDATLELAMGTIAPQPVTFKVTVGEPGGDRQRDTTLLEETVTSEFRWDQARIPLPGYAGREIALTLTLASDVPGTIGFWGTPTIRQSYPANSTSAQAGGARPRGVIFIHADTLRRDHLDAYGYTRPTAPVLKRLASEGVLFKHAVTQGSWTKVATPSFVTSLYASSHGIWRIPDRLPASATTLAEVYREAGYATLSLSSTAFSGKLTNLHQGYEELHESASLAVVDTPNRTKTSREYVDRLGGWLKDRRDVPFFVYLHVFDPHSPFEPFAPFNTMFADPAKREEHLQRQEAVRKTIKNAFLRAQGMATPAEVRAAKVDPEAFLRYEKDWYDGSIRAMDVELGRLIERLRSLGLDRDTAIVFTSDHGEEFQEHGQMWHGQSVYGEMVNVPLVFWWPNGIAKGRSVDEPAQGIDIMPTLLELSGLAVPKAVQGRSLRPWLAPGSGDGRTRPAGWAPRPIFTERHANNDEPSEAPRESYAIIDGGWKLIHHTERPAGHPEYQLFDFLKDPLDRQDVAAQHADVVARMSKTLAGWRAMTQAARLKPDTDTAQSLSAAELQRLRSLGYIK